MTVYLPKDHTWYDLRSGTAYKGGKTEKIEAVDSIPVFQRSGTIIPRKDRFRRSTVQMENDPYTLVRVIDFVKVSMFDICVRLFVRCFVCRKVIVHNFILICLKSVHFPNSKISGYFLILP